MSNTKVIQEWLKLTERTRRNIFEETARRVGLPNAAAVEKDWWVVRTLELFFASTIAPHTVLRAEAGFTDIEVGSRSLIEPQIARGFTSMVSEQFKGSPFANENKMESHGVGDIERNSKAFNIVIGSDSYF